MTLKRDDVRDGNIEPSIKRQLHWNDTVRLAGTLALQDFFEDIIVDVLDAIGDLIIGNFML